MQNKKIVRMEGITQDKNVHMGQRQKDMIEEIMIRSDMSYSKVMHHMDVYGFKKRFISGPYEGLVDEICNSIFMPSMEIVYSSDKIIREQLTENLDRYA